MPCYNTAAYKRLQRPLFRLCNYTAHAAKQHTGLCRRFPSYLPCFAAAVWRVHPAIPHRLRHAGRCTAQHSRPIIIRYIKGGGSGVPLLWIHTRQCSISQTMPARRGQLLPPVDRWQVLTRCQQYRPGAPAEGSASPPVQGHPGGWRSGTGQQSGRTGWHNPPGGAVQQQGRGGRRGTIGGSRRIYFLAFAR